MAKYTIDHLLRCQSEAEITVGGRKRTYYLMTVTQRGDDARSDYARAQARQAYLRLQDAESDTHRTYITDLEMQPRADLIRRMEAMKRYELMREARNEIHPLDAPEPSDDPTMTEVIEIEEANEQIQKDTAEERARYVTERLAEWQAGLESVSTETLLEDAKRMQTEIVLNEEFSRAWNDATLYHAVFLDAKHSKRLFANSAEASDCAPELYQALMREYNALDRFAAEPDELKN